MFLHFLRTGESLVCNAITVLETVQGPGGRGYYTCVPKPPRCNMLFAHPPVCGLIHRVAACACVCIYRQGCTHAPFAGVNCFRRVERTSFLLAECSNLYSFFRIEVITIVFRVRIVYIHTCGGWLCIPRCSSVYVRVSTVYMYSTYCMINWLRLDRSTALYVHLQSKKM
jgi:hypothetical protein